MNLTAEQRNTIQVAERVGASLSLAGVVFVIVTYALFKKVRNVSNTFIFYASVANVGASIACLIGYDGIEKNDDDHPLCQAQAFLLEMFMQSDPWWSLSMAINVFMVFFLHCNADASMKNMWIYSVISFGMPAIPAFICLFVRPNGTPIYGNATLWCWIGDVYNPLRIYSYYVPIWACIFITTIIYLAIGYHVFHGRNQLRDLTMSTQVHEFTTTSEVRDSAEKSLAGGQTGATITTTTATYGTVTTEVQVTTSAECSESTTGGNTRPTTPLPPSMAPQIMPANQNHQHHNSTGSGGIAVVAGNSAGSASAASQMIHPWTSISSSSCSNDDAISALTITSATPASPTSTTARKLRRMLNGLDPIKLAYLRTSFIFAVSVLVTWTPSSINRVYTLMNPKSANFGLNLASAIVLPLQGVWNVVIYVLTTWEVWAHRLVGGLLWGVAARIIGIGIGIGIGRVGRRRGLLGF
ncbi:cyclic AMP receptor-like protein A [Rhypophila decipiens]|uniref:Cyclic AMP receptor-like protein A n=1 Tax=Rhypophila decipiens TaxID=261697 RepID=A0AAN6YEW0_9PEZI|nr:cyclic AMP receptor-like protein A [Rhypophila decipiens]